jgi:hypothetical protein
MNNKPAHKVLERLEAALDEYEPGYANPEAIRDFGRLLKELTDSTDAPTNLLTEKIGSIRELIGVLYSPRKHQRRGGVEQVMSFIRQDLSSIRIIVERGRKRSV